MRNLNYKAMSNYPCTEILPA